MTHERGDKMNYRDMTFCQYWQECQFGQKSTCQRILSRSEEKRANTIGVPVAYFAHKPKCFLERAKDEKA